MDFEFKILVNRFASYQTFSNQLHNRKLSTPPSKFKTWEVSWRLKDFFPPLSRDVFLSVQSVSQPFDTATSLDVVGMSLSLKSLCDRRLHRLSRFVLRDRRMDEQLCSKRWLMYLKKTFYKWRRKMGTVLHCIEHLLSPLQKPLPPSSLSPSSCWPPPRWVGFGAHPGGDSADKGSDRLPDSDLLSPLSLFRPSSTSSCPRPANSCSKPCEQPGQLWGTLFHSSSWSGNEAWV